MTCSRCRNRIRHRAIAQSRRPEPAGTADHRGGDPAVCVSISGAGADPTGAEAPALPFGTQGTTRRLDITPGRGKPSLAGGRAAGRPRPDHDAHTQSQRRGSARVAWPGHAGSPGGAQAAGRAESRRSRVRRVQPGTGRARPSARHGPELVPHHEPRRRPGDRGPGLALATRVAIGTRPTRVGPRPTRMPTKPS